MIELFHNVFEYPMIESILLVILGGAVGFCTGFLGIAGGFIVAPIIRVFFEIPYPITIGTLVLLKIPSSIVSSYRYAKHDNILWRTATVIIIGSIPGIGIGLFLMEILKDGPKITIFNREHPSIDLIITLLCVLILLYFATKMLQKTVGHSKKKFSFTLFKKKLLIDTLPCFYDGDKKVSLLAVFLTGLLTGFNTSFLGISGVILVPLLIDYLKLPIKKAIGTSLVYMFSGSMIAGGAHLLKGNFSLNLIILLSVGAVIGAKLGSKVANLSNNLLISTTLIYLLYITSIIIIVWFLFF